MGYYYGVVTLSGLIIIPFALLRPNSVKNIRSVINVWKVLLYPMRHHVTILNKQHVEMDKPYIIVCNHQASIDIICMQYIMPDRCTVLVKKELLYAGLFGLAAWLCGIVFIDRLDRNKARNTMDRVSSILHDNNARLWIFPEGTRSHSPYEMLPFKKGAFNLAVEAQVPIVPVVLSSYSNFFSSKSKIFNQGHVIADCLPPISTEGLTHDDVSALAEKTRLLMSDSFRKISAKLTPLQCMQKIE